MKYIGWCLDQIQIVMVKIPRDVISSEDKAKAQAIINEVEKYAKTLAQIITNPEFKVDIQVFRHEAMKELKLQADEIEQLLKDLNHMLYELNLYIQNLREIIKDNPDQWSSKSQDLVHMIDQKFGDGRGELKKEFKMALHTKARLKQLVTSEEHLARLFS
jgi:hypothetical protein